MSIKLAKESYVTGAKEFEVPNGEKPLKLFAHEVGYLKITQLYIDASVDNKKHALTSLIVESVRDAEGNQFTFEEVEMLRKEVSELIIAAVMEVNSLNTAEEKK